jgi:hypothetical protein
VRALRPSQTSTVYFVCRYLERHQFRMRALTLLPNFDHDDESQPQVLCLQHYRAASEGWKDLAWCDDCVQQFRRIYNPSLCVKCQQHKPVPYVPDSLPPCRISLFTPSTIGLVGSPYASKRRIPTGRNTLPCACGAIAAP